MKGITHAAGMAFALALGCGGVQAQTVPVTAHDPAAAARAYRLGMTATRVGAARADADTEELMRTLDGAVPTDGKPADAAFALRLSSVFTTYRAAALDPAHAEVAPGARRTFLVTTEIIGSGPDAPKPGEPYRMTPIASHIPVLAVPAVQAILSTDGRFSMAGAGEIAGGIMMRERMDMNHDGRDFSLMPRLERLLPGSGKALERWNATAYPKPADPYRGLHVAQAASAESKAYSASHPRSATDGYSILAPGVTANVRVASARGRVLAVEVVNASRTAYRFAPEDHVYLNAGHLASLLGRPMRPGPARMHPATTCLLAGVPPEDTFFGVPIAPSGTVAVPGRYQETDADRRNRKRSVGKAMSGLVGLGTLVSPVGRVADAGGALGKLADTYDKASKVWTVATGKDMYTGDAASSDDAADDLARSTITEKVGGERMEEGASDLNKAFDMKQMSETKGMTPEGIADRREAARSFETFRDADGKRIAEKEPATRRAVDKANAPVFALWNKRLAKCGGR